MLVSFAVILQTVPDRSNASGNTVSESTPAPQIPESVSAKESHPSATSDADIDAETAGMYAEVASTLVTKVSKLNDISRYVFMGNLKIFLYTLLGTFYVGM